MRLASVFLSQDSGLTSGHCLQVISMGLSYEVVSGAWLDMGPVQAGLDAAAAAEAAQPGSQQHLLRAYAALLAVRHAGLCLLHFGIRCSPGGDQEGEALAWKLQSDVLNVCCNPAITA